jgi:hypothetical protein
MSELKATPGPWAVYSDDEVYSTQEGTANGHPMVIVPDSCLGRNDFDYEDKMPSKAQCRYNAHLVAAAPELYEALVALMDLESRDRVMPAGPEWDTARAALAKARGETL